MEEADQAVAGCWRPQVGQLDPCVPWGATVRRHTVPLESMPDDDRTARRKRSNQVLNELPVYRKQGQRDRKSRAHLQCRTFQGTTETAMTRGTQGGSRWKRLNAQWQRQMSGCWLRRGPCRSHRGRRRQGWWVWSASGRRWGFSPAHGHVCPSQSLSKSTLNTSSLLYVNYTSIKLFKKFLNDLGHMTTKCVVWTLCGSCFLQNHSEKMFLENLGKSECGLILDDNKEFLLIRHDDDIIIMIKSIRIITSSFYGRETCRQMHTKLYLIVKRHLGTFD